ncbi:MAG TPA: MBL fold metallo-hydrolase [Verrucomicrobiae bacterium]|nr:MBL fold metallo-hydrolase [Verrucomicrobiae bacterium]
MKTSSVLALAFALITPAALAQRNLDNVEIKVIPVSKNIYMLEGSGGNIGVSIGADGNLIVDDQFAPLAEKIDAAVQKLNPGKLKFVLNTHHHGDHTGGNAAFGAKDATIIAQSNVRKRLSAEANSKKEALPVITFDQSASVHFNGEEIKLLHQGPGHTDGDSIIFFTGANVVHMGDQFFNGGFPFVDLNSGGSVDGYIKTVATVLEKVPADAKIIPGHGKLASVPDLKTFHAMLVETNDLVKKGVTAGKSLADLKAAGLPEKFKDYGTGFIKTDQWIETIYNSATKK